VPSSPRDADRRWPVLPFGLVDVSGPSMVPTLRDGDVLLVRHGARIRPGDVVLARFRTMPERYVVKRAVRFEQGGWHLGSDNDQAGTAADSRTHGIADVSGRVSLSWSANRTGIRRWVPRRVR
jgi:signal peptidase I